MKKLLIAFVMSGLLATLAYAQTPTPNITPTPDPFVLPTPLEQASLTTADAYLERGINWYNKSQFVYAKEDFISASTLDPDNENAVIWQARTLTELGELEPAIVLMTAWLEQSPQSYRALTLRGYARLMGGDLTGEEDIQAANALNANDALHYYYLGLYYTALSDYDGAIIVLEQANTLAPDTLDIINARGIAYHGAERNEAALTEFDRAIALDASSVLAYVNKALLYRKLGQLTNAQDNITLALQVDEQYALAHMLRALIYIQQGNASTTVEAYTALYENALQSLEAYLQAEHPARASSSMLSLRVQLLQLLGQ